MVVLKDAQGIKCLGNGAAVVGYYQLDLGQHRVECLLFGCSDSVTVMALAEEFVNRIAHCCTLGLIAGSARH